jgi:hypothetical protein
MARPKLDCEVREYRIVLSLRVGEDDDLIARLDQTPARRRARLIKAALRGAPGEELVQVVDGEDGLEEDLDAVLV